MKRWMIPLIVFALWGAVLLWMGIVLGQDGRWAILTWLIIPVLLRSMQFIRNVSQGAAEGEIEYRKRRGLCVKCGYDIRATPDRCPECGSIPEQRPGASR